MPTKYPLPHVHVLIDFGVFGMRCGLGYYDPSRDEIFPAFVEFLIWNKWRVMFVAGKISGMYNRGY